MFEEITTEQQLKDLGLEKMAEFYNYYAIKIKDKTITKQDITAKHNITMGGLKKELEINGYVLKNYKLVKEEEKEDNELKDYEIKYLKEFATYGFSQDELKALRQILKNGLTDFRNPEHLQLIREGISKEKKQELFKFSPTIDDDFNEYCKTHKLFNKSEHVMLALLEYMDKYK